MTRGRRTLITASVVMSLSLIGSSGFVSAAVPEGMLLIPAGPFVMGSDQSEGRLGIDISVDSVPRRTVNLKAFYIDQYEVTIGAYRKYVQEMRVEKPAIWSDYKMFGYPEPEDDHPVVDVNWFDSDRYCRWVGKRLPTEAEWEKAARGTDGQIWPWGNDFDSDFANTESRSRGFTTPVGSMPKDRSPYGVYDMAGNAMEWTASPYLSYPGGLKKVVADDRFRVLRGGAWDLLGTPFSRAANREYRLADLAQPDFGFRCAMDVK